MDIPPYSTQILRYRLDHPPPKIPKDSAKMINGVMLELATPHMTRMTKVVISPVTLPSKCGENLSERIPIPSRETIDAAAMDSGTE